MADTRIKIAKDKAETVKALKDGGDLNAPFQTYADVVIFAAMLGAKQGRREPLDEICKSDPDPIPQEHFISRKYENIIQLLGVFAAQDPKLLADKDGFEEERIKIFEEYANAGLGIIRNSLNGSVDYLEQILLLLSYERSERSDLKNYDSEFDLSHFISKT